MLSSSFTGRIGCACFAVGALVACQSNPLEWGSGSCAVPGYADLGTFHPQPPPLLDLAFVVSNSPSMASKRDKLLTQFSKLMHALADPFDGSLPNLRVAFFDGNMGTSGELAGDAGKLQMVDAGSCGIADPAARWLQMLTLTPANYTGDTTQDLTCLLGNLPQGACAYQQLLRAAATSASTTGPDHLSAFVRKNAYLGLVFISDEDDCSTFSDGKMFAPDIPTEVESLRCATRAHTCAGKSLSYPTTGTVTAPLIDCSARTDTCAANTDTTQPTSCSPLADIRTLAQRIKALKSDKDMVTVTAIFGWPLTDNDYATATYKIDAIPNPHRGAGQPSTVYDLWPTCYDAEHPPSHPDPETGYDAVAAAYGAKPGLRLSAFVDEFGYQGLKFSTCQPDWSDALKRMGRASDGVLRSICLDAKLVDSDPSTADIEPDCLVDIFLPKVEDVSTPSTSACATATGDSTEWTRTRIPYCGTADGGAPCWKVVVDTMRCPLNGQMVNILNYSVPYIPAGTSVTFQCRVCPDLDAGVSHQPGCAS
jgi:hypothetical protein